MAEGLTCFLIAGRDGTGELGGWRSLVVMETATFLARRSSPWVSLAVVTLARVASLWSWPPEGGRCRLCGCAAERF